MRHQANRACPVFPELAGLFRKNTALIDVLTTALQPLADQIFFVFGSLACDKENRQLRRFTTGRHCRFAGIFKAL